MTREEAKLLISQARILTTLGIAVERKRNKLKSLVAQGIAYDDPKMLQALENFMQANTEWKQLEAAHLRLRKKLDKKQ